jgi:hypothetical protein
MMECAQRIASVWPAFERRSVVVLADDEQLVADLVPEERYLEPVSGSPRELA